MEAGQYNRKALVIVAILKMKGWLVRDIPIISKTPTITPRPYKKLQIIMSIYPQLKRSFFKDLYIRTDLMMLRSLLEFWKF